MLADRAVDGGIAGIVKQPERVPERSEWSRANLFHPVTFRTSRSRSTPVAAANRSACGGTSTALTADPMIFPLTPRVSSGNRPTGARIRPWTRPSASAWSVQWSGIVREGESKKIGLYEG